MRWNTFLKRAYLENSSTTEVPDAELRMGITKKINDAVASSIIGRRFRLDGSGHSKTRKNARFLTEIRAGLATFFAMAYIISVSSCPIPEFPGHAHIRRSTLPF
jgi:hypothetical protein